MSGENGAEPRDAIYSQLSTEEIENMLRFATYSDGDLDMEHIDRLLAELKRREQEDKGISPEEALRIFHEEYSGEETMYLDCAYQPKEKTYHSGEPEKKRRKRPIIRAALIAAAIIVFILASMIAVQAAGIDVFGAIARWTDDIFTFSGVKVEGMSNDIPKDSITDDYQTLDDALRAYGINGRIAPSWIPDGFEQLEFEVSEGLNQTSIYTSYRSDNSFLSIEVLLSDTPRNIYENTEAEVQVFNINGIDYYILENSSTSIVAWLGNGYECSISSKEPKDVLIKMIESIHE